MIVHSTLDMHIVIYSLATLSLSCTISFLYLLVVVLMKLGTQQICSHSVIVYCDIFRYGRL
jgi:ABC-type arginine/histidine transport system permease subunit